MKLRDTVDRIVKGRRIVYSDGRPGHVNVFATVLEVDAHGMRVQFEDRADTTRIEFADRAWMEHIEVVG